MIALSGCLASDVNVALLADDLAQAKQQIDDYRNIFGAGNFFVELHDHGMDEQQKCNRTLPKLAREFGLGLVAANDVHFLKRQHHGAHDVMLCIGTGKNVSDERRMRYLPELYFKSPAEMRALFRDHPESISNTLAIGERCDLTIEFGRSKYPEYTVPSGQKRETYLRELCEKGLEERYGECAKTDPQLRERLSYELGVLERTGFVSYILIVWDFIHFAKGRGIPVGPGRGSGGPACCVHVPVRATTSRPGCSPERPESPRATSVARRSRGKPRPSWIRATAERRGTDARRALRVAVRSALRR